MPEHGDKVVLNHEQYPSNSRKRKVELDKAEGSRPKRKQLATARRVKKPFFKRFTDAFIEGGAGRDVGDYILYDVVVPAAKSTIADLIEGAIEMILFGGERRAGNVVRNKGRSYVSYNDIYSGSPRRGPRGTIGGGRRSHGAEPMARIHQDFRHIVLNSRAEAEVVMGGLAEALGDYDVVTVAELYELVGLTAEYTDNKYGWYELPDMVAVRVRDGWAIELPRPKPID